MLKFFEMQTHHKFVTKDTQKSCRDFFPYVTAFLHIFIQQLIKSILAGLFGLIGGVANPSGVALIVILTVMVICSMPFVRKSGHFEIFYFTHLLYWAYFVLLILHAQRPWYFLMLPLSLFAVEVMYR